MKNIRIAYYDFAEELRNSVIEIALDYPKFEKRKKCYLYELFYFDDFENLLKARDEENAKYDFINQDFMPFFLKVNDDIFNQLKGYLEQDTEYEQAKWNDEVSCLNAILHIYRNDPKSWEI